MFKVNEELRTFPHTSEPSPTSLAGSQDSPFNSDVLRREGINVSALPNRKEKSLIQSSALFHPIHSSIKNLFLKEKSVLFFAEF